MNSELRNYFLNSALFTLNSVKGQSLVELIIAIGIAALVLPVLFYGIITSSSSKAQETQSLAASALLKEGIEAVRSAREANWSNIATNGNFHPVVVSNAWQLQPSAQTVGQYTRTVTIADAFRDSNGNLVNIGGTVDPSTKRVTVSVSWITPHASSVSSTIYLSRYLNNQSIIQPAPAPSAIPFSNYTAGGSSNVLVAASNVRLSGGPNGIDWCQPQQDANPVAELDLPKNGEARAITAIVGQAFAGTGLNASGASLARINVADTDPPQPVINGTFDGYKTNDVFGDTSYAYLATDDNGKEVVIVSTSTYTEIGFFNASGNLDANSVFIVGDTGYMTQNNRLRNFNLASCSGGNRTGSCPAIDSDGVALSGIGADVKVLGNFAYVAVNGGTNEMQIVDISIPTNLRVVGRADVQPFPDHGGRAVVVNSAGTRAYLALDACDTVSEFYVINVSTKTGLRPVMGSYDTSTVNDPSGGLATNDSTKGITLASNTRAIIVSQRGEEYTVLDVSSDTAPTRCGGLQLDTGIYDIAAISEPDGQVYSYVTTGDQSSEFKIFQGGDGGGFSSPGIYESTTFDAGSDASFNRFQVAFDKPGDSNITFQAAVAQAVSGSCTGATFNFQPMINTTSSTTGTTVTFNGTIAYPANQGRCFKYRATLTATSDLQQTPTLQEVKINYTP